MLLIKHGATPSELKMAIDELRHTPIEQCHYDNLRPLKDTGISPKKVILDQLMDEQGHLCAYCMRRIKSKESVEKGTDAHIEHWFPRKKGTDEQSLDYKNMLAVCSGTVEGTRKKDQTCDARKQDAVMKLDPRNASHIQSLSYDDSGFIRSTDQDLQACLDDTLNLNHQLPSIRRNILKEVNRSILDIHKKNPSNTAVVIDILQRKISALEEPDSHRAQFIGVTIWRLRNHVARLKKRAKGI